MSYELIFLINTFSTFFLTGLIWVIQRVHYPSFSYVHPSDYTLFQQHHETAISHIVVPLMILELVTSAWLGWTDGLISLNTLGLCLVLLIWVSTAFYSVPAHGRLGSGKDESAIQRLIKTNWIRTILWSLKSGINFWIMMKWMD